MSGVTLIDLELEYVRTRREYINNIMVYLRRVKDICKRGDPECKLIVFGSYVRGDMRADSDIDILLITDLARDTLKRVRLRAEIAREIGLVIPLEIHIVTRKDYEEWYKRFIDVYLEI